MNYKSAIGIFTSSFSLIIVTKMNFTLLFFALLIGWSNGLAQEVVINEIMSSNATTIFDEDGDTPDWIELFNPGSGQFDLEGYGLSDDVSDPFKWVFPAVPLPAQEYLIIFASNKNRPDWVNHWETIVDWGDVWKYRVGYNEPPSNWMEIDYNDSNWPTGPSGFGYGDNDDATIMPQVMSVYLRNTFTIDDLDNISKAMLHVDYDDAFVAYLNDAEIARANIGEPGIPPWHYQGADNWREALIYQGGLPELFAVDLEAALQEGPNTLAIQVHNFNLESSDMSLIPFLTLGMNNPPQNPNGIPEILEMNLPRLHTNFRINAAGETLVLSRPDGIVIDSLSTGAISADISKGRQPDGEINWLFFTQPTPGTSNDSPGYAGILEQPQFSHPGGLHPNPFELSITSPSETAQTRYSLDGSLPVETSAIYSGPIYIGQTTVVRAGTFEAGFLPSKIVTHTYLIDLDTELPIVSVSTDPGNFFDSDIGIYVDEHIWEDWERAIHLEFFEPGNELGFSIDAGAKIYGGWTRTLPQKSLAVFARGIYGCPEINYRIFPAKQIDRFEAIVLRNSGNDWLGSEMWGGTMLRDGLMTGLVTDSGVDIQAFRPAIVFINGEYWGIHNIREKINEHFIASNHGVDPGDIDLLEFNGSVIQGDNLHYFALIDFVSSNDLSDPDNYAYVESQLEIDNFIDYNIFQIYFANTDWPGNNIKFWRPRTENGKWRWILYDTDFGFGLVENYAHNTLLFALDDNGPEWPNPPWSTLLLRRLMENETFRNRFANRYCYYASTIFDSDNVLAQLNHFTQNISQEIPEHTIRWGWNMSSWNQNVNAVSIFGLNRPSYVRHHVRTYFGLNEVSILTLTISPENSGVVEISGLPAAEFPWLGQYFDDLPIEIEAIPGPGFQFSHWLQSGQQEPSISVTLEGDLELNAVFIPYSGGQNIVINEINYNSAPDFNPGDWVELYNNTNATIDLSGWVFKDSEDAHNFTFPANLALVAEEYLVLCRDAAAFSASFPGIGNYLGDFDFGLSGNGESIRLSDSAGNIIDSLAYDDNLPWPTEPDGSGSTLALIDPNFDNALPESWAASLVFGTPGMVNDVTDIVADENEFSLNQNYPNPFNPTTTIQFSLQNTRFERNRVEVTLSIYSISGRLVKRLLANERFDPGLHSVQWDGTDKTGQVVNSGVYLYRLQAKSSDQKEISQIRRMILLK